MTTKNNLGMKEETQGQPRTIGSDQTLGEKCADRIFDWLSATLPKKEGSWNRELVAKIIDAAIREQYDVKDDAIQKLFVIVQGLTPAASDIRNEAHAIALGAVGLKPARPLQNVDTQQPKSAPTCCADSEDTKRLDWLEDPLHQNYMFGTFVKGGSKTALREAIDAAIRSQSEQT